MKKVLVTVFALVTLQEKDERTASEIIKAVKAEFNDKKNVDCELDPEVKPVHAVAFNPAITDEEKLKQLQAMVKEPVASAEGLESEEEA